MEFLARSAKLGKMGGLTTPSQPGFFVSSTRRLFGNFPRVNDTNHNFNTAMPINHDEIFTWDSHHEWAFVGGPTTSPEKIKMADGGSIEFR